MYVCQTCNKKYENKNAFLGHCSSHKRSANYSESRKTEKGEEKKAKLAKQKIEGYCCSFCNKRFEKFQSVGRHSLLCTLNPKFKERIENIKKIGKTRNADPEFKKKLSKAVSIAVNKKVAEGTWHTSLKRTMYYDYKDIKVHGSWELKYVQWLDKNNISWRKVSEHFRYIFEGKERRYTPDFYLIDENCYIEVKGYETAKDQSKWEQFPKGLRLKVLKKEQLIELGIL